MLYLYFPEALGLSLRPVGRDGPHGPAVYRGVEGGDDVLGVSVLPPVTVGGGRLFVRTGAVRRRNTWRAPGWDL